jgi:hypothetical protein
MEVPGPLAAEARPGNCVSPCDSSDLNLASTAVVTENTQGIALCHYRPWNNKSLIARTNRTQNLTKCHPKSAATCTMCQDFGLP